MPRLNTRQAAAYIPSTKGTLDKLRVSGGGPVFIKIGRLVFYDTDDLDKWIASRKRASTCDTGTPSRGGAAASVL